MREATSWPRHRRWLPGGAEQQVQAGTFPQGLASSVALLSDLVVDNLSGRQTLPAGRGTPTGYWGAKARRELHGKGRLHAGGHGSRTVGAAIIVDLGVFAGR